MACQQDVIAPSDPPGAESSAPDSQWISGHTLLNCRRHAPSASGLCRGAVPKIPKALSDPACQPSLSSVYIHVSERHNHIGLLSAFIWLDAGLVPELESQKCTRAVWKMQVPWAPRSCYLCSMLELGLA